MADEEVGTMHDVAGPLAADRARIDRIVERLHETTDTTERADLASELVRAVARYEDVVERAVVPRMSGALDPAAIDAQATRREALRDAMTVIHERTMHIDPRNVHTSDPEGFEQAIDEVLTCLERHLPEEDRAIGTVVSHASDDERAALDADVESAAKHASERPRPPKTAIGRLISNAQVKLDHNLEDVATPQHPGADVVDAPAPEPPSRHARG